MARIRHLRVGRYWASEDGIAAIPAGVSIDLQIVDRLGGNRETFAPMGKWLRERLAYVTGPQGWRTCPRSGCGTEWSGSSL